MTTLPNQHQDIVKMRQFQPRLFALVSAVSMILTSGLATPAISAPTADFIGGSTKVKLSSEFINALVSLNVTPGTIFKGKLRRGVASFPITSGAGDLGTIKLEVNHQGGLSLKGGGTTVELTDFSITNLGGKPILTGLVKANDNLVGRIPLFDLALSENPTVKASEDAEDHNVQLSQVELKNVKVTLSKDAADALNSVFKVTAFKPGLNIGTASVKAFAR
jgi:hypothetical protein